MNRTERRLQEDAQPLICEAWVSLTPAAIIGQKLACPDVISAAECLLTSTKDLVSRHVQLAAVPPPEDLPGLLQREVETVLSKPVPQGLCAEYQMYVRAKKTIKGASPLLNLEDVEAEEPTDELTTCAGDFDITGQAVTRVDSNIVTDVLCLAISQRETEISLQSDLWKATHVQLGCINSVL
ncbi:MAG: hypothetical protein KVP17_001173 [Porospora cf. gigantea B]|uniref:uncharacterized protein n=1 Tax=Porospora cf. gigantea B TaxID=2853592 RepID=UPI0035718B0C|nr:MAG: hypothetical protein KVP17_001173 [Porospora cf. gigantea B]